jgi:hypothetical protein
VKAVPLFKKGLFKISYDFFIFPSPYLFIKIQEIAYILMNVDNSCILLYKIILLGLF